jgi:hypothetical protein
MSKKPAKIPSVPPAPVKTREQLMDERAAADFAKMDRINSDKSIEYRVMNEPDPNPLGPVPSEGNRAPQASFASLNEGLTFSGISASSFAGSNYVKSRRTV